MTSFEQDVKALARAEHIRRLVENETDPVKLDELHARASELFERVECKTTQAALSAIAERRLVLNPNGVCQRPDWKDSFVRRMRRFETESKEPFIYDYPESA